MEFNKSVDISKFSNIIQVSIDGPSVNINFLWKLVKHRNKLEIDEKMIDIGTCGLHLVHGSFNCDIVKMKWKVKKH